MTSVVNSSPSHSVLGTTFCGSISGCRAWIRRTWPTSFSFGGTARICRARAALAKITSSRAIRSRLLAMRSASGAMRSENAPRMRSISFFSLRVHCFNSFPASTTPMGSMNSVEPVPDWSWTMPGTLARHSAFTGTT